jgi:hypothetical protein
VAGNFTYLSASSQLSTTSLLSLTLPLPGSLAAGDAMVMVLRGQTSGTPFTFSPPAGWDTVGGPLQKTGGTSSNPKATLDVYFKAHSGAEANPTITASTTGTFAWRAQIFVWRGSGSPAVTIESLDETANASTSFTGGSVTSPAYPATLVCIVSQADSGGTLTIGTANGYTSQANQAAAPTTRLLDQQVTPGSYGGPTLTSSTSNPWMAKTFGIDNPIPVGPSPGWSVGQIKY